MDSPGLTAVWQSSSSNFTLWRSWLKVVAGSSLGSRHSTCSVRTASSMVSVPSTTRSNLQLSCDPCFCPCRYPSGNAHTNQLLECESSCVEQHLQLLAVVALAPRTSSSCLLACSSSARHRFMFPAVCLLVTILSTVCGSKVAPVCR